MTTQANILVIEDRSDWQKVIERILVKENFSPQIVASFDEAVTAMEARSFDLAVIDIVLDDTKPRFDRAGLSVINRIRELQPKIGIIIVSGFLTEDVSASLERLCPEAPIFLKESFDRSLFVRSVRHHLGQKQLESEPGQLPEKEDTELAVLPAPPPLGTAVGRPCVLLVENRTSWQKIVAGTLEEAGYFWRIARNAQEALEILEQISFQVIILDLKLQENDIPLRSSQGWLLIDHLVEARLKTKVVILSGRTRPDEAVSLVKKYPIIIDFIEKQSFEGQKIIDAVVQATKVPELHIQSLGQFSLWRDGQRIGVWDRPQAETLVKLLLVRRANEGHTMAADELMTYLWPDSDGERGRKKLLPLISSARRILEPDIEPRHSNFILRDANGYFFELNDSVTWDLEKFRTYLSRGQHSVRENNWIEAIIELEKGRMAYQGDFMEEDRYADWVIDIQREIANDYRDLLVALADSYAFMGHYTQAIQACEAALQKDPLLESVYRRLMRLHYCNGEKGQALKAYRDCLKLFDELFGESPNPLTRQLHEAIAGDEAIEYRFEAEFV